MAITRLPGYITIQMVRFHFKQKEAVNAKVLKDVKFPVMLDMFDMCSEDLQERLRPARTEFKAYEDWLVEQVCLKVNGKDFLLTDNCNCIETLQAHTVKGKGKSEALKAEKETQESAEHEDWWFSDDQGSSNSGYYILQAVLTHKGRSSNSGHYVGWVRQKGDTWLKCDDDEVSPIHEEDVLKLSGGGDWHTAYLLVYGPRKLPKERGQKVAESMETS